METLGKVQEKPKMGKIDFRDSHYQEKYFGKKKDTSDQNINRIMTCRIRIPEVHHFR